MEQRGPNLPLGFGDLLAAFADAEVRYLIIGGYAVGYHDRPRTTKDLDVLLDPAPENIHRACRALLPFGAHVDIAAHLEAASVDGPYSEKRRCVVCVVDRSECRNTCPGAGAGRVHLRAR